MVRYQPSYCKLINHEIEKKLQVYPDLSAFTKKQIILEMFIAASTKYFTVKSEEEMDLASVTAMNFMC